MTFINPIEILELQNYSVSDIGNSRIKKAKRKLFADIDLSDDGLLDYKGVSLTKSDCETAIGNLENRECAEFYSYLASNNQPLNDFLVNGDETFFSKLSQESIYKLPEFVNFISPYFAPQFDKALLKSFIEFQNGSMNSRIKIKRILQAQMLIALSNINTAYKSASIEITNRINQIEKITKEIKNKTTDYTNDDINEVESLSRNLFPIYFLNYLPPYFQSQINKIATAINQLQLAIWGSNLYNPSVCRQLLEHLLALNIESVSKQTFEKNYEIVKKADEKEKVQDKIQNHINKLIALINSFESKAKTIANARELIYQAKLYLFNIKTISQGDDNIYISLSTRVASIAQNFVVEEVNKPQSSNSQFDSILGFPILKSTLKNAWEVMQLIGSLEMQNDFIVNHYNPNKDTLRDICSKLNVTTPQLALGKIPQCNFIILDSTITHTDKDGKSLPITNPFIRGDVRYIGLNLKIESFGNQSVQFDLKYVKPNGTLERGSSSPDSFTFSTNKMINSNSTIISLSGWGNNEKGTYEVGMHHIEVWADNCMIYRKSFVVDWSQAEKIEVEKREAEMQERERIEIEKRKELARIIEQKDKITDTIDIIGYIIGYPLGIYLLVILGIWLGGVVPEWVLFVYIIAMLYIGTYLTAFSLMWSYFIKKIFVKNDSTNNNTLTVITSILSIIVIGFIIVAITKMCLTENSYTPTVKNSPYNNTSNSYSSSNSSSSNSHSSPSTYKSNDNSYSEPAHTESEYKGNQLSNGSSPLDGCFGKGRYSGQAWITFKNSNASDAIVCLVRVSSEKTIRNEYIRAGTNFTMNNIPSGTYYLKVYYGNDWNPTKENFCGTKGAFDSDERFSKSDNYSDYIEIENLEYSYTTGEITLYTVANGNMSLERMSASEFFNN
ncbi:MAG: hypothetical protein LBU44_01690 [Mediterranea sp.]|jgi:hypothetical protein|nr:hypothetical protein [Mediterranea sp.]